MRPGSHLQDIPTPFGDPGPQNPGQAPQDPPHSSCQGEVKAVSVCSSSSSLSHHGSQAVPGPGHGAESRPSRDTPLTQDTYTRCLRVPRSCGI